MKITENSSVSTPCFENITTYGELLRALPCTGTGKVPGYRKLAETASVVLRVKNAWCYLEVYDNGFYTYMEEGRITVYAVDRCSVLKWHSCTGEVLTSEEVDLTGLPWPIPLEIAGTNRLNHNSDSREESRAEFSLNAPASENNPTYSVLPEQDQREQDESEKEYRLSRNRLIAEEYESLTNRQKMLIDLFFVKKMRQKDIALLMNDEQSNISHKLRRIWHRFKKFL